MNSNILKNIMKICILFAYIKTYSIYAYSIIYNYNTIINRLVSIGFKFKIIFTEIWLNTNKTYTYISIHNQKYRDNGEELLSMYSQIYLHKYLGSSHKVNFKNMNTYFRELFILRELKYANKYTRESRS